jgi:glutathione S-transferase
MKLHWSPRSPYVRKVMVVAHEVGVAEQIECVRTGVSMLGPAAELFADNPLNKIPTPVLDDGTSLFDSRVICEYLDSLHHGPRLFLVDGTARFAALRDLALGDGLVDICMLRLMERLKPAERQSPGIITFNETKAKAALDRLETDIECLHERPYDIGHVAIGIALGYLDFRFDADQWRTGRPRLAAWYAGFAERPAVLACPVEDDS